MEVEQLRSTWLAEEAQAHIRGWDFSHLNGRYEEEDDLPWDYKSVISRYRRDEMELLDIDTGGGEFLLTLGHPYVRTAATEGYPPNVTLCRQELTPLGIDFREMADCSRMPFKDARFDIVIDRHGDYNVSELWRVLKPGGVFVTEQVGEDNDRDIVELLLPDTPKPFPGLNLDNQSRLFQMAGFQIYDAQECYRPIKFYDVGALVWFARIIEWEFPNFSVERCFYQLLDAQRILEERNMIEGTIHRFLLVARKGEIKNDT